MEAQKMRDFLNRNEFQKIMDAQKERDGKKKQTIKLVKKQQIIQENPEEKIQLQKLNEYTVTL